MSAQPTVKLQRPRWVWIISSRLRPAARLEANAGSEKRRVISGPSQGRPCWSATRAEFALRTSYSEVNRSSVACAHGRLGSIAGQRGGQVLGAEIEQAVEVVTVPVHGHVRRTEQGGDPAEGEGLGSALVEDAEGGLGDGVPR